VPCYNQNPFTTEATKEHEGKTKIKRPPQCCIATTNLTADYADWARHFYRVLLISGLSENQW
jgi:hypothetical protein